MKNLEVLESDTNVGRVRVHAVISSVIIAYVFTLNRVNLKAEQYDILLKSLRIPPDEEVCSEFMKSINEFDDNILRYLPLQILNLTNPCSLFMTVRHIFEISDDDHQQTVNGDL